MEQPIQPLKHQITVAICTCGRGEILLKTLDNLLPQARENQAEVLVIEQEFDHPEEIDRLLKELNQKGDIRRHRTPNDSLTGKRNIALSQAKADIILFVDDDVIIPPRFIERHIAHYQNDGISGVSGQVYHALNPQKPPSLDHPEVESRKHFIENSAMTTRSFIGCNHSVRISAATAVGGFDEQFIASSQCEDFDFSDRLVDAGYTLWYDPSAWLIHLRAKTGGTREGTAWPEWTRTANIFMYMFRHGHTHGYASLLWRAFRTGPLRKEVVVHPCSWPFAWHGFFKGLAYGWKHRRFTPQKEVLGD